MEQSTQTVETKFSDLKKILKKMGKVLVAFSGGVDSTLLLKTAKDVLGDAVLAVTALSETTPSHEKRDASIFAAGMRVKHLFVETHELDMPEFVQNSAEKCYICKKYRFGLLTEMARAKGFPWVADGGNQDDYQDYRPGLKAVAELGVRSPLSEAGLTKNEIRLLSEKSGLPTWNKPAYACLATRIPYNSPITSAKLKQVDDGETFIRTLGVTGQVRVRHYGDTARIEADPQGIDLLALNPLRDRVVAQFKKIGFHFITLDLGRYTMGSLNKDLNLKDKR